MKNLRNALAAACSQLKLKDSVLASDFKFSGKTVSLEALSDLEFSKKLATASDLLRDDLSPEDLSSLWKEAVYDASRIVQKLQQWITLANAFTPALVDHEYVQEAVTTFSDMKETVWFGMESIYPSAIMRERPEEEMPESVEVAPEEALPVVEEAPPQVPSAPAPVPVVPGVK